MSSEKDEERDLLVSQIDHDMNLRIVAREATDHAKRTIQLLLSISLAIVLFLAYRIYDTSYWVDVVTCLVFAVGMLPYGLWIAVRVRADSIKVLAYELSEVRSGLQMRYKARFWRVRRVAEEDERDEILGHTRRYITLFAIFTPLVIIMLVLSPITREETANEESVQSLFPAQSH